MKLTTKTKYGFRALLDLANQADGYPQSIALLAANQNISPNYLESIFAKLKKAGIVSSIRGMKGGYVLANEKQDITLYAILIALDQSITLLDPMDDKDDIRQVLHALLWSRIDANTQRYLRTLTLDQLRPDILDDLMYYI